MKLVSNLVLSLAFSSAWLASSTFASPQTCSSSSARSSFIAGNWKMNPTSVEEAVDLAKDVVEAAKTATGEVAVFVPFPFLAPVAQIVQGTNVGLGAQDTYTKPKGAFTGAVSLGMLQSVGVNYVLAGHSERRTVFGDSDTAINEKVRAILDAGMNVILCIGETKSEYEAKLNKEVCSIQLAKGLSGVTEKELSRVVIAYEPVWAIGTGLTCPRDVAEDVHKYIRSWFTSTYSNSAAEAMRIQYGGSVTPETVDDLMCEEDIDGALVGGASLVAKKFSRIINYGQ